MADSRNYFATSIACESLASVNLAQTQVELGRRNRMEPANIALLDQANKLYGGAPKGGWGYVAYILPRHVRANFEATKYREILANVRKALEIRPLSPLLLNIEAEEEELNKERRKKEKQ